MSKTWANPLRLITVVVCGLLTLGTAEAETYTVLQVIDGDTVKLEDGRRVRYLGIDAPEKGDLYYTEATLFNNTLVGGKAIRLEFSGSRQDKDGRLLDYVFVDNTDNTFVNEALVSQGFADLRHPVPKQYRQRLCQAQQEARAKGRGIWTKAATGQSLAIVTVHADAEGNDRQNLNDEFIVIENQSQNPIDLNGGTVSDTAKHRYLFANFTLGAKAQVTLRTGLGKLTEEELYWGSRTPIWNNEGDTILIRNAENDLMLSHVYGICS